MTKEEYEPLERGQIPPGPGCIQSQGPQFATHTGTMDAKRSILGADDDERHLMWEAIVTNHHPPPRFLSFPFPRHISSFFFLPSSSSVPSSPAYYLAHRLERAGQDRERKGWLPADFSFFFSPGYMLHFPARRDHQKGIDSVCLYIESKEGARDRQTWKGSARNFSRKMEMGGRTK